MECAFEGSPQIHSEEHYDKNHNLVGDWKKVALIYYHGFENKDERLEAIMENVIKNKGTFVV